MTLVHQNHTFMLMLTSDNHQNPHSGRSAFPVGVFRQRSGQDQSGYGHVTTLYDVILLQKAPPPHRGRSVGRTEDRFSAVVTTFRELWRLGKARFEAPPPPRAAEARLARLARLRSAVRPWLRTAEPEVETA